MSMMETIKEHPYMSVGGVLAVLVIVYVISRGGSSGGVVVGTAAPTTDPAAAQLAMASMQGQVQLQTGQMGADVAAQQIAANLHVVDSNNATAQNIAAIQAKGSTDIAALAATVQSDNIKAQESVALNGQQTALEAQQSANSNATEQMRISTAATEQALQTQAATILGTQAIAADVATHQADVNAMMFHDQVNAQVQETQIASNTQVQTAQIASTTQIQTATIAGAAARDVATTDANSVRLQLDSAWIREQYAAGTAVQIANTTQQTALALAPYQLAAVQSTVGGQIAIANANNNHGSLFGGLFQW